eukprot:669998-Rhodomonas_salina.1
MVEGGGWTCWAATSGGFEQRLDSMCEVCASWMGRGWIDRWEVSLAVLECVKNLAQSTEHTTCTHVSTQDAGFDAQKSGAQSESYGFQQRVDA